MQLDAWLQKAFLQVLKSIVQTKTNFFPFHAKKQQEFGKTSPAVF